MEPNDTSGSRTAPRRERLRISALAELFKSPIPGPELLREVARAALGSAAALTESPAGAACLRDPEHPEQPCRVLAVMRGGAFLPAGKTDCCEFAQAVSGLWDPETSSGEPYRKDLSGLPPGPLQAAGARYLLAAPVRVGASWAGQLAVVRPSEPYSDAELASVRQAVELFGFSAQWVENLPELAFLRAVVQSMREAVTVTDNENRLLFVNDAFRRLYGYTDEELVGQPIALVVGRQVPEGTPDRVLARTIEGGYEGELSNRRKDGSELLIHLSTAPVFDDNGEVVALVGVTTDITEMKRTENALRASESELRGLFSAMRDLVLLTDRSGRFLKAAGQPAALFFVPPEQFLDRSIREVLPEPAAGLLMDALARMASSPGPVSVEFPLPVGGLERWFEARVTEVEDRLLWVSRDITDRRRDEEARRKLEEQLGQAQKLESVGRLAGGIAHDFNNLLTVINGYSAMLLAEAEAAHPFRAALIEIHDAGERAARLVHQLLAFSRRQVLQPRALNVNRVLAGVENMLTRLIGEDIELATRFSPSLPAVSVDPSQLEQVILNLAVNARDAMPEGGTLLIETAAVPEEGCVRISVSDTGVGMTDEVRAHLFEPFFTTKEVGRGTGLGLSTVHGIVAQSGGRIEVESEPGKGATFHLYFRAVGPVAAPPRAPALPPLARGSETILLVEDQPEVLRFVSASLEAFGFKVLPAAGGEDAVRVCQENPGQIHLLLTDVMMPGVTGHDAALRILALRPGIKVLLMSGYTDEAGIRQGPLPLSAFIQKPFSPQDLAVRIRALLDED